MKFKFIYILALAIFSYLVFSSRSAGPANAGIGGQTGAPSEGLCSNCHSGGSSPSVSIQLLSGATPVTSYTAGQSYTLQVTVAGGTRYGAQAVVLNSSNNSTGTLSAPSSNARISTSGRTYLEHNNSSISGVFTATWVAPASGTGNITIYAAGLNANGTGSTSGDGTASTQISITESVLTTINYANSYCANATNPSPTITGTTGGSFSSSPMGLVFVSTSTGQINLANSTAGTYTITYTYNGGANTTTDIVTITAQDVASFTYSAGSYCQNAGTNPNPTLTSPNGGSFSSSPAGLFFVNNNTGQINLSASTAGNYTIRFISGGTCPTTVTQNVSITAANSSAFSYANNSFCAGTSTSILPTITGATGGTFAAQVGLSINNNTGEITINGSAVGNYAVTYTSPAPCASSSVFNLSVTARPTATISYPSATVCQSEGSIGVDFQGAAGGTYSALAGLDINSSSGTINSSNSLVGNYTVNYQTAACGVIASTSVQILADDAATISYPSTSYCQSQSNPSPSVTGAAGGSFSSVQSGIVLNAGTGEIDLAASSLGTFDIVYTTNGSCPVSDTTQVNILANGNAFFLYGMDSICKNAADSITPVVTGIAGGVFSSNNSNLILNSNTGSIDINNSPIGNYEVIYTLSGACPAADTVGLVILEADTTDYFNFPDTVLNWCRDFGYTIYLDSNLSQLGNFSLRDSIINCSVWTLDTSLLSQNVLYIFVTYFNPDSCYFPDRIPDTNMIYFTPNTNVLCPNIDSMILRFAYCESIDKLTLSNYQLFPNPAQNNVVIQNREYLGEMRIILYNAFGQVVDSRDINFNGRADYEISNLPTGLYWVEIQQADGRRGSYKLIKE